MQWLVKELTEKTITLEWKADDTIEDVQEKSQNKECISSDLQRWVYAGKLLQDEKKVQDLKIWKESTVHMVFGLRGGMRWKADEMRWKPDSRSATEENLWAETERKDFEVSTSGVDSTGTVTSKMLVSTERCKAIRELDWLTLTAKKCRPKDNVKTLETMVVDRPDYTENIFDHVDVEE